MSVIFLPYTELGSWENVHSSTKLILLSFNTTLIFTRSQLTSIFKKLVLTVYTDDEVQHGMCWIVYCLYNVNPNTGGNCCCTICDVCPVTSLDYFPWHTNGIKQHVGRTVMSATCRQQKRITNLTRVLFWKLFSASAIDINFNLQVNLNKYSVYPSYMSF